MTSIQEVIGVFIVTAAVYSICGFILATLANDFEFPLENLFLLVFPTAWDAGLNFTINMLKVLGVSIVAGGIDFVK